MDLPRFNLSLIERRRDRLYTEVFEPRCGRNVDASELQNLLRGVQRVLPRVRDGLFESLRALAGHVLTPTTALRTAWLLAGNVDLLQAGTPVRDWTVQVADEWVPLQVLAAQPAKNRKGFHGTAYTFRVLAGTPCPSKIQAFWKPGLVNAIQRRLGFTVPTGRYPFHRPVELVGLRFLGQIQAAWSQRGPRVFEINCPSAMAKWNRTQVLAYRSRHPDSPGCPRTWRHDCYRCAVGYFECPAGVHSQTYQVGDCTACGTVETVFDPAMSREVCRSCAIRSRLGGAGGQNAGVGVTNHPGSPGTT